MNRDQFIEWLDQEIEDNDRRMEEAGDSQRSSYYLGCATGIAHVKEKFIAIYPPSPSLYNLAEYGRTAEGKKEGEQADRGKLVKFLHWFLLTYMGSKPATENQAPIVVDRYLEQFNLQK